MKTASFSSFVRSAYPIIEPIIPLILAAVFFVTGIIFGSVAIHYGSIKEFHVGTAIGMPDQYIHADAIIYATGFISAACFVVSGLILIKRK